MKKWFILFCATVFIGCAHVPIETVELSQELTGMIVAAEESHMALIEQYINDHRRQAEDYLNTQGIPAMMEHMIDNSGVMDDLEAATSSEEKAAIMAEFTSDANIEIADWRNSMMQTLDEVEALLKTRVHEHYMDMLTVNAALTAHLSSAAKISETREQLFSALDVDSQGMLPLDRINGILEKVITAEVEIEDIAERVNQVRDVLSSTTNEETE